MSGFAGRQTGAYASSDWLARVPLAALKAAPAPAAALVYRSSARRANEIEDSPPFKIRSVPFQLLRAELDPLARHPHVIERRSRNALENAFTHAYPGREAVERDEILRALQRLLEARDRAPRLRAPIRLHLVRD
jgi:hypothetical protein